jgi:hypothetical protein
LTGHAQFGRREAFVSSADVSGDLGGIAGADALCQSLAGAAGLDLPGSFKALLASSAPASGVTDRFQFDGPWFRRDGLLFAHDKAELIGGAVTLPLNVSELGTYVAPALALTGATRSGLPIGLDCGNWTLAADAGVAEAALTNSIVLDDSSGGNWLSAGEIACGGTPLPGDFGRKIMCLSDSDVIFHDAYEPLPESP